MPISYQRLSVPSAGTLRSHEQLQVLKLMQMLHLLLALILLYVSHSKHIFKLCEGIKLLLWLGNLFNPCMLVQAWVPRARMTCALV